MEFKALTEYIFFKISYSEDVFIKINKHAALNLHTKIAEPFLDQDKVIIPKTITIEY